MSAPTTAVATFTKSISSPFLLNKFETLKSAKENPSSSKITESKSMLFENVPEHHFRETNIVKNNSILKTAFTLWDNFASPTTDTLNLTINANISRECVTKKHANLSLDQLRAPLTTPTATSCPSTFIDAQELKRKLIELPKFIVILLDCRTYSDFNLKHIKDSVHLNCRDKLIKKRLQTRKLTVKDLISNEEVKSKLESNEDCLMSNVKAVASAGFTSFVNNSSKIITRLSTCTNGNLNTMVSNDSEEISNLKINDNDFKENKLPESENNNNNNVDKMIVIYDDKTSDLNELQSESNPLKIVQENIKQSGYNKECNILKGKLFRRVHTIKLVIRI